LALIEEQPVRQLGNQIKGGLDLLHLLLDLLGHFRLDLLLLLLLGSLLLDRLLHTLQMRAMSWRF
jgi:hypothetical protein